MTVERSMGDWRLLNTWDLVLDSAGSEVVSRTLWFTFRKAMMREGDTYSLSRGLYDDRHRVVRAG